MWCLEQVSALVKSTLPLPPTRLHSAVRFFLQSGDGRPLAQAANQLLHNRRARPGESLSVCLPDSLSCSRLSRSARRAKIIAGDNLLAAFYNNNTRPPARAKTSWLVNRRANRCD